MPGEIPFKVPKAKYARRGAAGVIDAGTDASKAAERAFPGPGSACVLRFAGPRFETRCGVVRAEYVERGAAGVAGTIYDVPKCGWIGFWASGLSFASSFGWEVVWGIRFDVPQIETERA